MIDKDLPESIRAFVAIHLPEPLLVALRDLQRRLEAELPKGAVRWTAPEQIHLTLKFLGNIASSALVELQTSLEEICANAAPLLLRAQDLGCFSNRAKPRVIWVGLAGESAQLLALQSQIDSALQRWCEKAEARAFHPHLTIGRLGSVSPGTARRVGASLKEASIPTLWEWEVESVKLMRSKLSPQGAEHSILASLPLRSG